MLTRGKRIFSALLSLPVQFYRHAVSPYTRPSCRHVPTCSQYALDALKIHGPLRGLYLTLNRILRCRPGGTHGYDPVPVIWIKHYRPAMIFFLHPKKGNRLKH